MYTIQTSQHRERHVNYRVSQNCSHRRRSGNIYRNTAD